jgi:hypothetical protein
MTSGRAIALYIVAVGLSMAAATSVFAQDKREEQVQLKKPELAQLQALSALVDAVMSGKEPAPADVKLKFQHHFVKSTANIYVPFVIEIAGGTFSSFPVAMYVRAVRKGETVSADAKPNYAFTDIYFLDAKRVKSSGTGTSEVSRGLELPPGEFDVYIAMMETPPRTKAAGPGKRVVHKETLSVPDFSGSLTTSSVILAKSLDEAPPQLTAQQQLEEPFTIGGYRITPAFTSTFPQSGELLFVLFIYNVGALAGGKPDVDVNYLFFRAAEAKPFSKAATTTFNATTLPAEFNTAAGHQLVLGQGIPLTSFAPGDYKLEIRINDKTNGQAITRTVPFTVVP